MTAINPTPAIQQAGRQYYPALDGLRGLAILLVVVYHNFGFIDYFFFGWLGVDLFFVLSGFLITDILLKTVGQKNYLKNFYIRRALRIFPLYYLALILFLLLLPRITATPDMSYYTANQVWLWTYMQNWLYIFNNPGATNALNHLWSLSVEEQFYLLWPLVILSARNPKTLLILITVLLIAVLGFRLWIWQKQIANLAYFNLYTFSRIDGICIGCMIALIPKINPSLLKRNTPWIILFFALLNFIFFFINRGNHFSFPYLALIGYSTFGMLFGLLVNEVVTGDTKILKQVFSNPPLRFLGRISYGLYIFHWPVYLLSAPLLYNRIAPHTNSSITQFLTAFVSTVIAIIISWLSYNYYERYFLNLKSRFI